MKYDKKELANKAKNGDEESLGLLILISDGEEMGDMSGEDWASHVAEQGDEEQPEEDVTKVVGMLMDAGLPEDEAMNVSSSIFQTLGLY